MLIKTGDMWSAYEEADLFLITTNAVIRKDGALVMGAGIAKQARNRFPGLDRALGQAINARGSRYGLLVSPRWPSAKLGAFQVKHHWRDSASVALIEHSARLLALWCQENPTACVHLNFPGIGNGKLSERQVLPVLEPLPNSVTVWKFKS